MERLQTKDWDRDRVWQQIEEELRKKRRKRALLFWWLGVLSLGLLTFSTYIYLHHHDETELGQLPVYRDSSLRGESAPLMDTKPNMESTSSNTPISSGNFERSIDQQAIKQIPTDLRPRTLSSTLQLGLPDTVKSSPKNPKSSAAASSALIKEALTSAQNLGRMPLFSPLSVSPSPLSYPPTVLALRPNNSPAPVSTPWQLDINSTWSIGQVRHVGSEAWVDAKEASESFHLATTHSLVLGRALDSHWYAYLGIQHQWLLSTYDFTTESVNIQTVPSDSAVIYQLDGLAPIYEPGTLQETTTNRRWIVRNNKLHRWAIPLGLKYRQEKGRVGFQASLGMHFQFWQGFRGAALDELTQTHILDQGEIRNQYYRNPWQFNFNTSFALSYKLHPQYTLLIGLDYQKDNLFSIRQQPYQSTYELWGVSIGIRIPMAASSFSE